MKRNKIYLIAQAAACIALAILLAAAAIAVYREGAARRALDPLADIYTPEIVAARLRPIAPVFFLALGLLVAGLVLGIRDPAADRPSRAPARPAEPRATGLRPGTVRAVLLAAAAILIVAGILNGSARDVLYKAVAICTECVGLG